MKALKPLMIGGVELKSRLLVGTGKFPSPQVMAAAIAASGTDLVTVALRRVDLENQEDATISALDFTRYRLLPNTSGARDADEAIRLARLARAVTGNKLVKLEVTPDPNHLLPDPVETLKAAEQLVNEGFVVLPYMNVDPVLARRLAEVGCATVMPLASPIGTNRGLQTTDQLGIIIAEAEIPVVVDAGLGLPSHAAAAIELGADAVLVNTAIALAADPVGMAKAFSLGVEAAVAARNAGPEGESFQARASSPLTGFLHEEAGR